MAYSFKVNKTEKKEVIVSSKNVTMHNRDAAYKYTLDGSDVWVLTKYVERDKLLWWDVIVVHSRIAFPVFVYNYQRHILEENANEDRNPHNINQMVSYVFLNNVEECDLLDFYKEYFKKVQQVSNHFELPEYNLANNIQTEYYPKFEAHTTSENTKFAKFHFDEYKELFIKAKIKYRKELDFEVLNPHPFVPHELTRKSFDVISYGIYRFKNCLVGIHDGTISHKHHLIGILSVLKTLMKNNGSKVLLSVDEFEYPILTVMS